MQNLQNLQGLTFGAKKSYASAAPAQTLPEYIQSLSGLVAYYQMDEASGNAINTAPDTIGTLDGTNSNITYSTPGQVGDSYTYNGTTSQTVVANNAALQVTTGLTLGAIIRRDVTLNVENGISTKTFYNLILNSSGNIRLEIEAMGYTSVLSNGVVPSETWTYVIATYDMVNLKIYMNGVIDPNVGNRTDPISTNSDDFRMGVHSGGFFPGELQHEIVMNRAVTAEEVLTMAQLAGLA